MKKLNILIVFVSLLLVSCSSTSTKEQKNLSSEEYAKLLSTSNILTIEEEPFSMGKEYKIYSENILVAIVKGKALKATGDILTMTDPNGKVLMKEKQLKRWGIHFTRNGVYIDDNEKEIGYLGEILETKLTNIGHFFYFYDKDKKKIGTSDEVIFSYLKKYNFNDTKGNIDYEVSQEFDFVDTYQVKVVDDTEIHRYQALLMVCIQDAIKDAEEEDA